MTRPWIIWLTATFCVLIVLGAVGMMTHTTLNMEKEIYVVGEKQQRVEKAVETMESYIDSLLARENSRPAGVFAPLQTKFNNATKGNGVEVENDLSPLFDETPEDVNYYWFSEVGNKLPGQQLVSPQLPRWGDVEKIAPNDIARDNLEQNIVVHEKLSTLMNGTSSWSRDQSQKKGAQDYSASNLGQVSYLAKCASVHTGQVNVVKNDSIKKDLAEAVALEQNAWAKVDETGNNRAVLEKQLRNSNRAQSYSKVGKSKVEKPVDKAVDQSAYKYNLGSDSIGNSQQIENPFLGSFTGAEVSPFVSVLIDGELMLIRNVATEAGQFVQGVWLNKEKIKQDLLALVSETYLPNAKLSLVAEAIDTNTFTYGRNDIYVLSQMPLRLEPGDIPILLNKITPMRLNLIIAWACVVLAVVAVSIMFKGVMKLSERRASFVSSVSHELRTPLTTFKLYSEMLASGMIKDPVKKQDYLETLMRESDRLSHMVENVLSFSQIERGKGKRELCKLPVGDIVRQLEPCFRMRLAEEGMSFENDLTPDMESAEVMVDLTSVDQILSNLVDNAAKYGQNKEANSVVRITAERQSKFLLIYVSDDGIGVKRSDGKRLFKAFHKSDVEAAHSKPGVGLGLALCQKLARSMGGNLSIAKSPSESGGACFELKLPLA